MENTDNNITNYFKENKNQNINVTKKSILPAVLVIIISLAVLIIAATPVIANSYLSLTLIILMIIALCAGIIMLVNATGERGYNYIYLPANAKMKKNTIYISPDDISAAKSAISAGNFATLATIEKTLQSPYCLEIWGIKEGDYYIMQLMKYNNFLYRPETEITIVTDDNTAHINQFLQRNR